MGIFTYKEIQDKLFREKKKHQDILQSSNPQINKTYSRHAVYVITDLQRDFKKLFLKKYGEN